MSILTPTTDFAAFNTDNITEGSTNLFHTSERVDDRVNALLTAGSNITLTYDDAANTLTVTGLSDSEIVGKVLGVTHAGDNTLQSANDLNLVSGTDAGEHIFANSTDAVSYTHLRAHET